MKTKARKRPKKHRKPERGAAPVSTNGATPADHLPKELRDKWIRTKLARARFDTLKGEAKEAKKVWEAEVYEYGQLMEDFITPKPLFEAAANSAAVPNGTPAVAARSTPAEDDSWRQTQGLFDVELQLAETAHA